MLYNSLNPDIEVDVGNNQVRVNGQAVTSEAVKEVP